MNKVPLVDPALDILEPSWENDRLDLVDGFRERRWRYFADNVRRFRI